MIDLTFVSNAWKTKENETLGFLNSEKNPVDASTKFKQKDSLTKILLSAELSNISNGGLSVLKILATFNFGECGSN